MSETELSIIELDTNLADVEKPPELPAGRYVSEIQDVQIATSANSGNQYFAIKCHVSPDDIPAEMQEHYEEGAVFFWNRQLVPKSNDRRTLWALQQLYKKMGLDPNITVIDPNAWMGQKLGLVLASETYNGETRTNVKSVYAVEEAPAREAPAPKQKAATGRGRR